MSFFESGEGAKDNLGKKEDFKDIEDLAIDNNPTPDEEAMLNEEDPDRHKNPGEPLEIDLDDELSDETSNWEDDVKSGKYDEMPHVEHEPADRVSSFHGTERRRVTEIENMDQEERAKFENYDYLEEESHKPKPEKPKGGDTIRYDEAA